MVTEQIVKDIRLYLKLVDKDTLTLADFPSLVQSKWGFLKDNWDRTLKNSLLNILSASNDTESAQIQIAKFDNFIQSRRHLDKEINILEENDIIYNFFDLFDLIPINWLPLSKEDNVLINKMITNVSNFNKLDWISMKKNLYKAMLMVANAAGEEDSDVDSTYDLKPIDADHSYSLNEQDRAIFYLNHIRYIDFILSDKGFNDPRPIDPFALAKFNANNPKFNIDSFNAGLMVRMNTDDTLQTLSNRYYDTPDKWLQIAIANGLQPPYIDADGETISLLANGIDNKIYLPATTGTEDNINKFYIGQPIYLSSTAYSIPELRIIKGISEVPISLDIVLEVEGTSDLSKYRTVDGALLRVYQKYTTNSNYFILIPSANILPEDMINRNELPWFLRIKADDEINQKVDLFLDNDKDLTISSSNDLMLSYGLNNAVQALMLKFMVEMGEIVRHPRFGFVGGIIGSKNINLAANQQKITDYISEAVSRDDRFDSIVSLSVETHSTYYVVYLVVRLAGGLNKLVPVSFKIPIQS